jgi:hypothetical protein
MRSRRTVLLHSAVVLACAVALPACAAKYAQVPPRLDLTPYGRIALAEFAAAPEHRAAAVLATGRFAEALLASQRIELLEMGAADTLWQVLGDSAGVPAVVLGELTVTEERPRGSLSLAGLDVRSTVVAELRVRLVATASGGTLWRASSRRRGTVGRVAVTGSGVPTMSVRDREAAYGELVQDLVADVTHDLRASWVKQ